MISLNNLPRFLGEPDPEIYLSDNFYTLDVETTNYRKGNPYEPSNSLIYVSWKKYQEPVQGEFLDEFELTDLIRDLLKADFLVAHNTKFELGWLNRGGFPLEQSLTFCTQIAEYVLQGNKADGQMASLESCLRKRGLGGKDSYVSLLIKKGICPSLIHKGSLSKYGNRDVLQTEKLFLSQREELKKAGLLATQFTRCLLTPVLVDIEQRGMNLSKDRVRKLHEYLVTKEAELSREWDGLTGGINTASPKQKREYFYETLGFKPPTKYNGKPYTTETGELATDKTTLSRLKPKNKKQARVLQVFKELNRVNSLNSKFVKKLLQCVEDKDAQGILKARINQTRTATHRLSSTGDVFNIQLQNIYRPFKSLFEARYPGWAISENDQGSLEFNTAVHLGRDEVGKKDLEEGRDPHAFSASIIFDDFWDPNESPKGPNNNKYRQDAKAHTFKPLNIAA